MTERPNSSEIEDVLASIRKLVSVDIREGLRVEDVLPEVPAPAPADDGALLLTPGFFTDALGLSLMVPGIRGRIFRFFKSRIQVQSFSYGDDPRPGPDVIDGDYEEVEQPKGPSGWTQH